MIGTLVMSSQRVLFHACNITTTDDDDDHKENDLSIDSSLACVHALQEQDEDDNGEGVAEVQGQDTKCIYLQLLTTTTTESNDEVPIEMPFIPQGNKIIMINYKTYFKHLVRLLN